MTRPRTVPRNVAVAIFAVVAAIELHALVFVAYLGTDFRSSPELAALRAVYDTLGAFWVIVFAAVQVGLFPLAVSPVPLAIVLFGAWITLRRGDLQPALLALLASSVLVLIEPILVYLIF